VSHSDFCIAANKLATLSLIFGRRVDGAADSEDSHFCSVSVLTSYTE
jgi:hypothetical protein